MIKRNKHIEIVSSTRTGLSSVSQASCDAICSVLTKYFTDVRISVINDAAGLEALVARHPDLVFMGMKFVPTGPIEGTADSPKVWLSDFLDDHGITYTGSGQTALEIERNKPLAKQRILQANLKTSAYFVIEQNQSLSKDDIAIHFPLFIKPVNRGGGFGIDSDSVAHNFEQLRFKVSSINTVLSSDALIEEYLPGREFSVAILKEEFTDRYEVMPIELIAPLDKNDSRILSSYVKSSNIEQALVVSDEAIKSKVMELALNAFNALGARDYGRIDIRLDAAGTPHFLEANLKPSLTSGYGSFPKACKLNIGMEYGAMIMRITNLGLSRSAAVAEATLQLTKASDFVYASEDMAFDQV